MKKLSAIILIMITGPALMAQTAGQLDTTFSSNGYATYNWSMFASIGGLIEQPDTRILMNGKFDESSFIGRINNDSTPDLSFGINGIVIDSVPGYPVHSINSMHLLPGGEIMTSAFSLDPVSMNGMCVYSRFHADGSRDTTFGTGGYVMNVMGQDTFNTNLILPLPGGKSVIYESSISFANTAVHTIMTGLNIDGSLDTSFGNGGQVISNDLSGSDAIVTSGGKIIIYGLDGFFANNTVLAAFNSNGSPDLTFGINGISASPLLQATSMGEIFSGNSGEMFTTLSYGFPATQQISNFDSTGTKDPSFGFMGDLDMTGSQSLVTIETQDDGKILCGGRMTGSGWLSRLLPDGSIDSTFGISGQVIFTTGTQFEYFSDLLNGSDGKIYAALNTQTPPTIFGNAVVRFTNDVAAGIFHTDIPDLTVYPNPASGEMFVSGWSYRTNSYAEVSISDLSGRNMYMSRSQATGDFRIDTSNLAGGTYLLTVSTDDFRIVKKIVILR